MPLCVHLSLTAGLVSCATHSGLGRKCKYAQCSRGHFLASLTALWIPDGAIREDLIIKR